MPCLYLLWLRSPGEIAAGAPLMPLAAATDEWAAALAPRLAAGDTWFSAPWFLVENYLYKRMLELTDGPSGGRLPSKSNPSPNPNPNLTLTLALVLALALTLALVLALALALTLALALALTP